MGLVKGLVHPNVQIAFTALHFEYTRALDEMPELWSDLIVEETPPVPSLVDTFFIDLTTGGFRPWTGDRQMRDVLQDSFSITKEPFEDSMRIPKLLAMNGTYGAIARSEAQRFAANRAMFRDDMANKMLRNGTNATLGKCWDGKAFFATDHPVNVRDASKGSYPNRHAINRLNANTWPVLKSTIEAIPAPNGKAYKHMVTGVIYPPAREADVKALFGKEYLSGGESNEYANDVNPENRRKAMDLADEPQIIYVVASRVGLAKALPMAQTEMNTATLGEESEYCITSGYVGELADFFASCGYGNPRLLHRVDCTPSP